jgi:hypothetical protein
MHTAFAAVSNCGAQICVSLCLYTTQPMLVASGWEAEMRSRSRGLRRVCIVGAKRVCSVHVLYIALRWADLPPSRLGCTLPCRVVSFLFLRFFRHSAIILSVFGWRRGVREMMSAASCCFQLRLYSHMLRVSS